MFEEGFSLSKVLLKTEEALVLALCCKFIEKSLGSKIPEIFKQIENKIALASKNFPSFEEIFGVQGFYTSPHLFELLREFSIAIKRA